MLRTPIWIYFLKRVLLAAGILLIVSNWASAEKCELLVEGENVDAVIAGCTEKMTESSRLGSSAGYKLALCFRGRAYREKGEIARAIADLSKCIALWENDPKRFEYKELWSVAYQDRGKAYRSVADFDHAISDFVRGREIDSHSNGAMELGIAYIERAKVSFERKDYQRAIEDYKTAMRGDPDFIRWKHSITAYLGIISAYEQIDELDQAIDQYSQ